MALISFLSRENPTHAKLGLGVPSLPPGYKQTEVGVSPEEWEVKTID
jgi:hypothetical protein